VIITSRMIVCASEDQQLPHFFSMLQRKRQTPIPAVLLFTLFSLFFLVFPYVDDLIDYVSCIELIGTTITCFCVVVLRKLKPEWERPNRISLIFPFIYVTVSLIVIGMAIQDDYEGFGESILIMCIMVPVYFIKTYCKSKKKNSGKTGFGYQLEKLSFKIIHFIQKLFLIASQDSGEIPLSLIHVLDETINKYFE